MSLTMFMCSCLWTTSFLWRVLPWQVLFAGVNELTSFRCSQKYTGNYTADDKETVFIRHYSESSHEQDHCTPAISQFSWQVFLADPYRRAISAMCQSFFLDKFFTHKQIKLANSELVNENLLVCNRLQTSKIVREKYRIYPRIGRTRVLAAP